MKEQEKNIGTLKHKKISEHKKRGSFEKVSIFCIIIVAALILFNQFQISAVSASIGRSGSSGAFTSLSLSGDVSLDSVDVTQIKSTAQGVAALFPIDQIKTTEDAIAVMIAVGTPDYGEAMGVSFDDPVNALGDLANAYGTLKQQAQQNPEIWERYLSLAAAPRGVSCEFCCGVGAQGVDARGNLRCGCKHNPGAQAVALWLMLNTDYSDAQILKEVYRWKSIWFPRNMVGLASQIAGGDDSILKDLPGMVGGC